VYFDGDDDLCIQWPALLAHVDLLVKKHVFKDRNAYARAFTGKNNLTDYVARQFGTSFSSDIIPTSGVVAAEHIDNIRIGWNIAHDDRISRMFGSKRPPAPETKTHDVICRASVPRDNWMFPLRAAALRELEKLGARRKVLAPTQRVSQRKYFREMRRSRICVSPFGYGEICWRDFEAVLSGCLLVKPDVSHIQTTPNIFIPGETYVPVRWDFSDLAEQCERYLEDETERRRIAARAYETLAYELSANRFAQTFGTLIDRIGLAARRGHARAVGA
jgi:hypothetical protein